VLRVLSRLRAARDSGVQEKLLAIPVASFPPSPLLERVVGCSGQRIHGSVHQVPQVVAVLTASAGRHSERLLCESEPRSLTASRPRDGRRTGRREVEALPAPIRPDAGGQMRVNHAGLRRNATTRRRPAAGVSDTSPETPIGSRIEARGLPRGLPRASLRPFERPRNGAPVPES
jgi:hypothetical protein